MHITFKFPWWRIAGAAMSGLTKDEIVHLTGYPADLVLRICTVAGVSEST